MNLYKLKMFSSRFKLALSLTYLTFVVIVLILSVVRMFTQPAAAPRTRASTMSLGMSAKSLGFLAYELLTEHVKRFNRWKSLKAYFILNALDIVFWGAVAYMVVSASISYCEGTHCILGWVVVGLSVVLNILAQYLAVICFLDWRYAKNHDGMHRPGYYVPDNYETKISDRPSSADNSLMTSNNGPRSRDPTFEQAWPRSSPNAYNSVDPEDGTWELQPKSPSRVRTRDGSQGNHGASDNRGHYGSVPGSSNHAHGSHSRHHSRSSSGSHARHGQSRSGSHARDPNAARHHQQHQQQQQQQQARTGQYADTAYHGAQNNQVQMPAIPPSPPQVRPGYPARQQPPSYYSN